MLEKLRTAQQKHRQKTLNIVQNFAHRIESVSPTAISLKFRQELLVIQQQNHDEMKQLWDLESTYLEHLREYATHLHGTRKSWKLKNDIIVFYNDHDLMRFTEIKKKIKDSEAKALQIRQDALNKRKAARLRQ